MKPGEVITKNEEINLNKDSKVTKIKISNSGDRPVQVGSHYHFFETNEYLVCLLYTSPSPRDRTRSRMPSSA